MFDNVLLRKKRTEKKLLPMGVSKELNISLKEYRDIEEGLAEPSDELVNKLCNLLDIDKNQLIIKNENEEEKTITISFFNNKGGVGKSTSTATLASAFGVLGKKVLVVDFDEQANTTRSLGLEIQEEKNVYNFMCKDSKYYGRPDLCIIETAIDGVDIISGASELHRIYTSVMMEDYRDKMLLEFFTPIIRSNIYDYILFDNGPQRSIIVRNTLYCCDYAIAPVSIGEQFSFDGLDGVYEMINSCLDGNIKFKDLKILMNKYDRRVYGIEDYKEKALKKYEDNILDTIIRIDSHIERSFKNRETVFQYNPKSKGAEDFLALAKELEDKLV